MHVGRNPLANEPEAEIIDWHRDGSFTITGGEYARVLGWAQDAHILDALLSRLGTNVAARQVDLSRGPRRGEPPTYPPPQWQYPFDFTVDIAKLTTQDHRMETTLAHLGRIRNDLPDSESDLNEWITHRARQLQAQSPQVAAVEAFGGDSALEDLSDPRGFRGQAEYCTWIDPRLIISTPDKTWNDFNRRPEVVPTIVRAVRDARTDHDLAQWISTMFTHQTPDVVRVEGPAGPVYDLGSGGSHRVHAARILDLPYMVAEVHLAELPYPTTTPDATDQPAGTMGHVWRALQKRNVLSASTIKSDTTETVWVPVAVTAEWMLLEPELATSINRSYEQLYPGALTELTGMPVEQLTNERFWLRTLTTPPTLRERTIAFLNRRSAATRR